MFAGKAGAYPSEATQGYAPDLTHETLDSAGKACQGQKTLAYYKNP